MEMRNKRRPAIPLALHEPAERGPPADSAEAPENHTQSNGAAQGVCARPGHAGACVPGAAYMRRGMALRAHGRCCVLLVAPLEPTKPASRQPARWRHRHPKTYCVLHASGQAVMGTRNDHGIFRVHSRTKAPVNEKAPAAAHMQTVAGAGVRWWAILDSNQWPPRCQRGALTN